MKNYIFYFRRITIGGAELLIEKIAREWQLEKNVYIVYENIMPEMKNRLGNVGVTFIKETNWENFKNCKKYLKKIDNPVCITFEWDIFLPIYMMKIKNKKTIFYSLDYTILSFGYNRGTGILHEIEKKIVGNSLVTMIDNENVISQDEQTNRFTANYFKNNKNLSKRNLKIIRIPVDVPEINKNIMKKRAENSECKILSIARADFPFKGYLLGIIDFMQSVAVNSELDIVSYGKDIDILKRKIDSMPESVRKRIHLHGKTDYDELDSYFDNCKVYIGMGTTVIDAAMRGILSIPVCAYTENLLATHYFHDDYRAIAIDSPSINKIEELYKKITEMSYDEYLQKSIKSRELAIKHYSTEMVANYIEKMCDIAKEDYTSKSIIIMYLMRKIEKFLKNNRFMDKNVRRKYHDNGK